MTATATASYEIKAKDSTKRAVASASDGLKSLGKAVTGTKAKLLGLVGAGGFSLLVKHAFDSVDALAKMSDRLGLTTEALGGLQHAAGLTGVQTNQLNLGLQRMTRRIAEAAQGTGEAKNALRELGLDARELSTLTPDAAFSRVADAMQNVEGQSNRVRLAFKLFDSEGVALVNTLNLGSAGLSEAAEEARALGVAVTRIDAAKVEIANDAFTRAKAVITGVVNQIAIHLAPFVKALSDEFVNSAKSAGGMANFVGKAFNAMIDVVGFLADAVRGLQVAFKLVTVAVATFADQSLQKFRLVANAVTSLADMIPGLDVGPNEFINSVADSFGSTVDQMQLELTELVMQPMPSDNVKKWAQDVQFKFEETARKVAEQKKIISADFQLQSNPEQDAKQDERLRADLDKIQTRMQSETELLRVKLAEDRAVVEESLLAGDIQKFEHDLLLQQLETEHQAKLTDIAKKGAEDRARSEAEAQAMIFQARATVVQQSVELLQAFAGKSKGAAIAAIVLNKALSIAQAIQNTGVAVTKALTIDPTGSLAARVSSLGAAQVAIIGATGLAQAAGVGGGGASAGSPANPINTTQQQTAPAALTPQNQQQTNGPTIVFQGDVYGLDDFRDVVEGIIKDGSDKDRYTVAVVGDRARIK